jgi:CRISPR-associated endonuclease/helicase Cas3
MHPHRSPTDEVFRRYFRTLSGHHPFPWQRQLFQHLARGEVPGLCDVLTGLGKTLVIAIWLIALALGARLPLRLVYVVNRRAIVDQATEEAERFRHRLREAEDGPLTDIRKRLVSLATVPDHSVPFALSTLRGAYADNREWSLDAARPAVIVGTVDMIGSRLLFSGYRDGYKIRPFHTGLVGQDTLIVHDEAHLTPAFGELLRSIRNQQLKRDGARAVQVLELSATSREMNASGLVITAEHDPKYSEEAHRRVHAAKTLQFHECAKKQEVVGRIAELAGAYEGQGVRVLIYARTPEDAGKLHDALTKRLGSEAADRLLLLTGTLRGHERDELAQQDSFHRFQAIENPGGPTIYLVSTSAGEVGVNLNADHMVSDLTTLDSMIQRLGRVNRFGRGTARVDVVFALDELNNE